MSWNCGLQFRVRSGPSRGLTMPIDAPVLKIGRARNPADRQSGWIKLQDDTVSRLHCEIFWQEDRRSFRLLHRSTTNSTYINGEAVEDAELFEDDVLELGATSLELQKADLRWSKNTPSGGFPTISAPPHSDESSASAPPGTATRIIPGAMLGPIAPTSGKKISMGPPTTYALVSDLGEQFPLQGIIVRFGAPEDRDLETEQHGKLKFDREYVLDHPMLSPNNLILRYDELSQRYRAGRFGPDSAGVYLFRDCDGVVWQAELREGAEALLSEGDVILLADIQLQFGKQENNV